MVGSPDYDSRAVKRSSIVEAHAQAAAAPAFRVLVADDDRATRMLVHTCLRYLGYFDVVQCIDGEEALAEFKARPAQLVISDFNMPKLDGLGLLREIRSMPGGDKTPFVLLTSRGEAKFVRQALMSQVSGYLVKPFTIAGFQAKVDAAATAAMKAHVPAADLWEIHE